MATQIIDGERKVIVTLLADGLGRFDGLARRSEWRAMRNKTDRIILTQRAFMGAMLHDQSLKGQFPKVGHTFALALLTKRSGQFRNGAAMDAHLSSIAAESRAGRAAVKVIKTLRNALI